LVQGPGACFSALAAGLAVPTPWLVDSPPLRLLAVPSRDHPMCNSLHDSPKVRTMRCHVIAQLVCECIMLIFSVTTLRDYGYIGLAAGTMALVGTITALSRTCGSNAKLGYSLCVLFNAISIPASLAHCGLTLWLLFTVEDWCCSIEGTSLASMRILLGVIAGIWLVGVLVRAWVIYQIQGAKEFVDSPGAHRAAPVAGAPVVVAVNVTHVQPAA